MAVGSGSHMTGTLKQADFAISVGPDSPLMC